MKLKKLIYRKLLKKCQVILEKFYNNCLYLLNSCYKVIHWMEKRINYYNDLEKFNNYLDLNKEIENKFFQEMHPIYQKSSFISWQDISNFLIFIGIIY